MKVLRCATFALGAMVVLICGCGGTTFNPTPAPTALFPQQITAGSQTFTVFISGTNFQTNSTVQWNGVNRPGLFNSTTEQMAMIVFDTDVATAGQGQVTVTNPLPGGGVSLNPLSFTINGPAVGGPQITSVSPASAVVGSSQNLVLTVNGTGLASTDTVNWNGTSEVTTTSGSPVTSLSTTITAENLATVASISLSIQTSVANIASPAQNYQVGPASNPVPSISSIAPNTTKIGALPTGGYVVLTGKNFVPTSTVLFNGSPRSTGYLGNTQIAAVVLASDVATGGTIAVTVSNPNPGGGASGSSSFSVQ